MMIRCVKCDNAAKFICNCQEKELFWCDKDLNDHVITELNIWHKPSLILDVNQASKDFLLSFLHKTWIHTNRQKDKFNSRLKISDHPTKEKKCKDYEDFSKASGILYKEYDDSDELNLNNLKLCESELNEMLHLIESLRDKIKSISYIIEKEFYSPLENFLLNKPKLAKNALASFTNIKINYSKDPKTLSTSNLSNMFSHYSNYIVYIKSNLWAKDYSGSEIALHRTDARSRFILVSPAEILRTGGFEDKTICEIINIETKKLGHIQRLNVGRYWHTVTRLRDDIIVIGGSNGKESLTSVEIYKNYAWIEIASLNLPRQSPSSVSVLNSVYVIGGLDRFSIEKYYDDTWHILPITLPTKMAAPGAIGISQNILLIFGGGYRKTFYSEIFKLNLLTGIKKSIGQTKRQGRVPYGVSIFKSNQIFAAYYMNEQSWQDHTDIYHEIWKKKPFGIQF